VVGAAGYRSSLDSHWPLIAGSLALTVVPAAAGASPAITHYSIWLLNALITFVLPIKNNT